MLNIMKLEHLNTILGPGDVNLSNRNFKSPNAPGSWWLPVEVSPNSPLYKPFISGAFMPSLRSSVSGNFMKLSYEFRVRVTT